ncbi:tetratricopeptide repeat protein [uncultured Photobacterium sp.]|uniref:tetratricopeptide repeat protein n=1 Tax=uncultured Photobacterium sp. TaxID=173973 RepID=UPI0026026660|nr:tetratricopeptide repeat protein [uncultured Photobacterium sp.]
MRLVNSKTKSMAYSLLLFTVVLGGCASSEETAKDQNIDFNHELYNGKPTLSLSNEFPPETPQEAIMRGDKAYLANDPDLALYEFIRALSFPSQDNADQAYYKIGYIHQQRKNYELAKVAYSRAALIDEDNIQYAASIGIVELKLGEQDNARKQLLRTVRMDQERQGNKSFDQNKDTFARELTVDKKSPLNAYIGLGILADLDARHKQAQQIYQTCLRVDGKSYKALTNLGYSYYLDGNLHQAEVINRRATTLYPNDSRAWANLGLTYIKAKRYDDAVDTLSRIMKKEKALNDIGYFAMLAGDYETAVNYLEQAINASPTYYAKAYQNLKRAKKLQITAPPVRLTNKRDAEQSQATVYTITDTTH